MRSCCPWPLVLNLKHISNINLDSNIWKAQLVPKGKKSTWINKIYFSSYFLDIYEDIAEDGSEAALQSTLGSLEDSVILWQRFRAERCATSVVSIRYILVVVLHSAPVVFPIYYYLYPDWCCGCVWWLFRRCLWKIMTAEILSVMSCCPLHTCLFLE